MLPPDASSELTQRIIQPLGSRLPSICSGFGMFNGLLVDILPGKTTVTFLFLAFLTCMAALFPTRGASRQSIVDALGHV